MSAETDIAAIDDSGANTAAEVRTALTSVLARADDGTGRGAVSVYLTSDQTGITTAAAISWDAAEWENNGDFWSSGTNPTRLTIPAGEGGIYACAGAVSIVNGADGNELICWVSVSGTPVRYFARMDVYSADKGIFPYATDLDLSASDYVEVFVQSTSDAVDVRSGAAWSYCSLRRVG